MRALPALLVLLLAPLAAGQEKSQVFVVADTLDLRELMDFWIATKNLNLQFEEGALQGPVKLRTHEGISLETLWAVTNRELVAKGLACIQVPGESNLSVVPLDKAAALARVEVDVAGAEAGYVRALFSLRRVEPGLASTAAKALLPEPEGKVTELQETKQLLFPSGASSPAWLPPRPRRCSRSLRGRSPNSRRRSSSCSLGSSRRCSRRSISWPCSTGRRRDPWSWSTP